MSPQRLHPTIEEFKGFVKKHPKLIQEVRKGNKTWQELYEDWFLLGETDDTWKKYANVPGNENEEESKSDFVTKIFSSFKNVNMNDVQQQITNVGSAISTIQQVIQQFQGSKQSQDGNHDQSGINHPFAFRKD
jgi:hypothetical protein